MKELIRNGSFERGDLDFWTTVLGTVTVDAAVKKRGSYSAKLVCGGANNAKIHTKDYIPLAAHELYKLTAWLKSVDLAETHLVADYFDVDYDIVTGATITLEQKDGVFDWTLFTYYFNAPSEASYMRIYITMIGLAAGKYGYADVISLQQIREQELTVEHHELVTVANLTTKATYYGSEFFTGIWTGAEYHLYCTSLTGTSPTLDVTIQGYDPNTEQWKDIMVFQQLDAAGSEFKTLLSNLGWKQRVKYVTAGTAVTDCDFKVGVVYKR